MKYWVAIFFISSILVALEPQDIPVSELTNHIYRRMCYIEQLRPSIEYIRTLDLSEYPALTRTIIWEFKTFEHFFHTETTQDIFQSIAEEKNLDVLCNIWSDFEQYKHLEHPSFSHDFIRILFIVTKSLCIVATTETELLKRYAHGITLCHCLETALDLPIDQLAEIVGVISKFCQSRTKDLIYLCEEIQERLGLDTTKHNKLGSVDFHVGSQEVLMRFYYIQRLSFFYETIIPYYDTYKMQEELWFTNHCVKQTVIELKHTSGLTPILDLFDDFCHYKNAYDSDFNREALILFFLTLKKIAQEEFTSKKSGFIEQIMAVYKEINTLPIEEILDAIDLTIDALQTLKEQKQTDSRKILVKATWWTKVIGVLLICLKVIHHYHYYY